MHKRGSIATFVWPFPNPTIEFYVGEKTPNVSMNFMHAPFWGKGKGSSSIRMLKNMREKKDCSYILEEKNEMQTNEKRNDVAKK